MSNLEHKVMFNESIDEYNSTDNVELKGKFEIGVSVNNVNLPIIPISIGEILGILTIEQMLSLKIRIDNEIKHLYNYEW